MSSSPTYDHVVWQEKKTGRGTKITGKVVASPHTPKARKLASPKSKRRKMAEGLSTAKFPDVEDFPTTGPIPIALPHVNKRGGKVFSVILHLMDNN